MVKAEPSTAGRDVENLASETVPESKFEALILEGETVNPEPSPTNDVAVHTPVN